VIETYDFKNKKSLSSRRFPAKDGFFTTVYEDQAVFGDYSEKDKSGLYRIFDIDSGKISSIKVFPGSAEAFPLEMAYGDGAFWGFLQKDKTLEFCRWK
jgi:hypothetical protein